MFHSLVYFVELIKPFHCFHQNRSLQILLYDLNITIGMYTFAVRMNTGYIWYTYCHDLVVIFFKQIGRSSIELFVCSVGVGPGFILQRQGWRALF